MKKAALVLGLLFVLELIPVSTNAAARSRTPMESLVIGDDEDVYKVSGSESWERIEVLGTGTLVLLEGSSLQTRELHLFGESVFEMYGGNFLISNLSHAGVARLVGDCSFFNVTNNSQLIILGSNGYANTSSPGPYTEYIPVSKGGDALLHINCSENLRFEDSCIELRGGQGFDLPASNGSVCNAWVDGENIHGHAAAGGNASIRLNLFGSSHDLSIRNTNITVVGGCGGKAADGGNSSSKDGARGGGYCNGATVSGFVGAGGQSEFSLSSKNSIYLRDSQLEFSSGNGGDAGDGGSSGEYGGSGGGGYCGGNGVSFSASPGSGGIARGHVGSGGDVLVTMDSRNLLVLSRNHITVSGGNGGDAGQGGGMNESQRSAGGRGGGGFFGGSPHDGYDGQVYDRVGSGANISMVLSADVAIIDDLDLFARAGDGGEAGKPGEDCDAAGGGGYGGAGGGYYSALGGSGTVVGEVGVGGSVEISIKAERCDLSDTHISLMAGNGGNAADGGNVYPGNHGPGGRTGGGGGGGYGGGGAATAMFASTHNTVSGSVGMGGSSHLRVTSSTIQVDKSLISCQGGHGGDAGGGGNTSDEGSSGGGGYGGGAGGSGNAEGGCYTVEGTIGRGGDASFIASSNQILIKGNSIIGVKGGDGGDGGKGGKKNNSYRDSAGGGGYGGGGGGTGVAYRGGSGIVSGTVGDGGDALACIYTMEASISQDSSIVAKGGKGGFAPDAPGEGECGGEGEGRETDNGTETMELTLFQGLAHANDTGAGGTVNLAWIPIHNPYQSVHYNIYVSDESGKQDFLHPDFVAFGPNFTVTGLEDNVVYYFVVRAANENGYEEKNEIERSAMPTYSRPIVIVLQPENHSKHTNSVVVQGMAFDNDGFIQRVEVSLDRETWWKAQGAQDWSFHLSVSEHGNGSHVVWVRAYDGEHYSTEVWVHIQLEENEHEPTGKEGATARFSLMILLPVIALLLFLFLVLPRLPGRHPGRELMPPPSVNNESPEDRSSPPQRPQHFFNCPHCGGEFELSTTKRPIRFSCHFCRNEVEIK